MLQTVCMNIILVALTVLVVIGVVVLALAIYALIHELIRDCREAHEEDKGE